MRVSEESSDVTSSKAGKVLPTKKYKSSVATSSKTVAGGRSTTAQSKTMSLSEEPVLDLKKMKAILQGFGEYPEKYRLALGCSHQGY